MHDSEIQEESTEQHEHHSTHHDEAELAMSVCFLAKSMYLETHIHEQDSTDERMDKEQEKEQGNDKRLQRIWDCAKPKGEQEGIRYAEEQDQREKKADAPARRRAPDVKKKRSNSTPGECEAREKTDPCEIAQCGRWAILCHQYEDEDPERHHRRTDESGEDSRDPDRVRGVERS